jgi:hypothetical protein
MSLSRVLPGVASFRLVFVTSGFCVADGRVSVAPRASIFEPDGRTHSLITQEPAVPLGIRKTAPRLIASAFRVVRYDVLFVVPFGTDGSAITSRYCCVGERRLFASS